MLETPSVLETLAFLTEHTGQDELSLLSRAMDLGLQVLYEQTVQQAFIDGQVTREEAVEVLGLERVRELEYAKQALAQDIRRGLEL